MPGNMTHKELHFIEDCLGAESLAAQKCSYFSSQTTDQEVAQMCTDLANKHQQHYNTLLKHLQSSSRGIQ